MIWKFFIREYLCLLFKNEPNFVETKATYCLDFFDLFELQRLKENLEKIVSEIF